MRTDGKIKIFIILFYVVVLARVFYIGVIKKDYYEELYRGLADNYVVTNSAPRGRIIDSKGNILVDNKGVREVIYREFKGISEEQEFVIAESLAQVLEFTDVDVDGYDLKEYYFKKNRGEVMALLDQDIKDAYRDRLIDEEEYEAAIYDVISDDDLATLNEEEVYIFMKMNDGYLSDDKVIKRDISLEEYTLVSELNLSGIRCDMYYERVYNYDTYLNQLFGSVGAIPKEEKSFYLLNGYMINDTVGISFLEEEYEEYLKGVKGVYKVNDDNTLSMVKEEERGYDLVLSIDIEVQMKIEEVLVEEIKKAKKVFASKYYNGSYIVVSDPSDGSIVAAVGINYNDGVLSSDVIGLITNSYTVGSVVKGASHTVAYMNGVLDEDTRIRDACVKLYSQEEKCSWKNLGVLNDIDALVNSSNYFQFVNAIRVSGYKYKRNMVFNPNEDDFNKYRDVFAAYGLGSLTGVDIEGESMGIRGKTLTGDLLLNLSIGQYDTYTPLQLNQYISTIANDGVRYKMRIAESIIDNDGNYVTINPVVELNKIALDKKYLHRIKEGLEGVVSRGTGYSYIRVTSGAGKTGTSETFYNGKSTITQSFVGYFPSDNPRYAYSIISPHISYENNTSNYQYPINSRLSRAITNILFEN